MKSFQKTVFYTALVLLIIILTAFAILLKTSKGDLIYPPILTVCPDNYKIDGTMCKIGKFPSGCQEAGSTITANSLGQPSSSSSNTTNKKMCCKSFNIEDFKKLSYLEKKREFKKLCPEGSWDGLTNLNFEGYLKEEKEGTKSSNDNKIKKHHVILFLIVVALISYFAFL